jgi:phosphate/sulfate permease
LAIGSVIPWLLLLVLPFLPLSLTERAMGAAGLLVMAEVMFWVGAVLAGQEVVRGFRQKLNPKALWKHMGDRVQRIWRRDR